LKLWIQRSIATEGVKYYFARQLLLKRIKLTNTKNKRADLQTLETISVSGEWNWLNTSRAPGTVFTTLPESGGIEPKPKARNTSQLCSPKERN